MDNLINKVFFSEELIDVFKELINIPSENPGDLEERIAMKIKDILKKEGIPSELKYVDTKRPNLYAVLEGEQTGKTLLYNGHLDTVPVGGGWNRNPFDAYEDEAGYIYGRGAADMKSGVAAMLYAVICLKRMGYPKKGKLILFLNVDEEVSNLGMRQFLQEEHHIDYAIISEPSDLNINIGHKGTARYKITTKGTAGHAAFVQNPDNAIEKMNELLIELFHYSCQVKLKEQHELLGTATSNITMIEGGIAGNIIPNECSVIIDRRILPGETEESIKKEYEDLLLKRDTSIKYELETLTYVPPSIIDSNHELVKIVYEVGKRCKSDIQIKDFEATCEAPFFSVMKGIPTIIYGPGKLDQAHVANEYVQRLQVIQAGRSFIKICLKLLK